MRALITGVTGQDGWYLSEILTSRGYDVFGLVSPDDREHVPFSVRPLTGDMRDAASLGAALDASEPDEVYNLASISSVGRSWRDPELVADVNGVGVVRLLAAIRERGNRVRVVQASSAEIFGNAAPPQNERTPIAPVSPYGAAKAFAHHSVAVYRSAGIWASSAILYNHESPRRPASFVTRKITKMVASIAAGGTEHLVLGNLDARRDWGFARDYAEALTLMAQHEQPEDFVVATGVSHTIAEFVAAAFARVGITDWSSWVDIDPALQRDGDATEQRGDATRIRDVLGWRPTVDFGELVGLMVDGDLAEMHD
jgi:GDPmannose 4,6-dehydratase